jgi:hypothetical protein
MRGRCEFGLLLLLMCALVGPVMASGAGEGAGSGGTSPSAEAPAEVQGGSPRVVERGSQVQGGGQGAGLPGRSAPPDELFERGNQAYLHGDYRGAIDAYEQLVAQSLIHEDLYYALGNAYFKADRIGPAILNYERALVLDPDQEDVQANLKLARQTAAQRWQDKLVGEQADPPWMRLLASFTPGGLTLLFLGLYWALFLLLALIYFLGSGFLRVAAWVVLVFVLIGTIGAGGLLAGRWWLAARAEYGIVLADEAQVKEGPDQSYQTSFVVHGGLRARAVLHDAGWVKVRLSNGLEGWLRDREFGRL